MFSSGLFNRHHLEEERWDQGGERGSEVLEVLTRRPVTCRWLTMQNGSGRVSPQVELDESWWARPIRRSPVAG